jgi:hypothetical protein
MTSPKKIILPITLICIILSCLLGTSPGLFALEVTEVMVSDVTPASFCVVFLTSEKASADIALYQDTDGLYPVSSYTIIDTPCTDEALFSQAAQKGIRKIKVTDLSQDTTYYFKLIATSTEDPNMNCPAASRWISMLPIIRSGARVPMRTETWVRR